MGKPRWGSGRRDAAWLTVNLVHPWASPRGSSNGPLQTADSYYPLPATYYARFVRTSAVPWGENGRDYRIEGYGSRGMTVALLARGQDGGTLIACNPRLFLLR